MHNFACSKKAVEILSMHKWEKYIGNYVLRARHVQFFCWLVAPMKYNLLPIVTIYLHQGMRILYECLYVCMSGWVGV